MSHAGVKIRTHHRGGFVDACQTVSLCESGGGPGNDKCRRKDKFLSVVLVHKLFLFFAVKRVDGPFSGGSYWITFFGLVVSPFVSTNLGLSVADGLYLALPCRVD